MPRYFFDLANHENDTDTSGTDCADADAARREAVVFAGSYLRDHPELVWDGKEIRIIVRNENDQAIFTVVILTVDCL